MLFRPNGSPRLAGAALAFPTVRFLIRHSPARCPPPDFRPEVPVSLAPFTTRITRITATQLAASALLLGALSACSATGTDTALNPPTASSPSASSPATSASPQLPVPGSTIEASALTAPDGILTGLALTIIAPDITGDAAADTTAAIAEVRALAELHGAASIRILPSDATAPIAPDELLASALADEPDVIVVLGEGILGAVDNASASNLGQQFVLLGAQLPEPTGNVTAVVWPGADVRLSDGISPEIAPHASEALEAGLTAIAAKTTGIVLALR